jgi:hypothetical protein
MCRSAVNGPNKLTVFALSHVSLNLLYSLTYNFLYLHLLYSAVSQIVFVNCGMTGERLEARDHGATEEVSS